MYTTILRSHALAVIVGGLCLLLTAPACAQPVSCTVSSECDDGLFCNGPELCLGRRTCIRGPAPCQGALKLCDEFADRCRAPCEADSDCDDGLFCNGTELCISDAELADQFGCVRTNPPCLEGQRCLEDSEECVSVCPFPEDEDGDGYDSRRCGGSDCDDTDPTRSPGNPEVCDDEGKDEDCDPRTFGTRDADGDGFVDSLCCNTSESTGEEFCGTDCSDALRIINPGRLDICDGFDNDCNGFIDDGVRIRLYPDKDGDGFGDEGAMSISGCPGEDGFSTRAGDCDDTNPAIVPGAMVCEADGKETVLVCQPTGLFTASTCPIITDSVCVTLPNGTADCEPRKCIVNDPPPTPTD